MTTTLTKKALPDRSLYLPPEARLLRSRITSLYEHLVPLLHEAEEELDVLGRECDFYEGGSVILEAELRADGICGYASTATLRVPKQFMPEALENLQRLSVFGIPIIADWYERYGNAAPKAQLYLEMSEHLRLLTMEYIERFNDMIIDQRSF